MAFLQPIIPHHHAHDHARGRHHLHNQDNHKDLFQGPHRHAHDYGHGHDNRNHHQYKHPLHAHDDARGHAHDYGHGHDNRNHHQYKHPLHAHDDARGHAHAHDYGHGHHRLHNPDNRKALNQHLHHNLFFRYGHVHLNQFWPDNLSVTVCYNVLDFHSEFHHNLGLNRCNCNVRDCGNFHHCNPNHNTYFLP